MTVSQADRRNRSVLPRYFLAAVCARSADEGARVALVLLALEDMHSTAAGGLLVAVLLVPHVVAAPNVGRLLDQTQRPGLVVGAGIAIFAGSLASTAVLAGRIPIGVIAAILLIGGCCGPVITGGLTGQLAGLVHHKSIGRVFGLDSFFYNIASMAGPAVISVVNLATNARAAQLVLAGTAAVGAAISSTLPGRTGAAAHEAPKPGQLLGALRIIHRVPQLALVTSASTIGQLGMGALPVISAAVAATYRHPEDGGLLLTAMAGGSLLGSVVWTLRPAPAPWAPMIMSVTMIGSGVTLTVTAFADDLVASVILFGIAGFFIGPFAAALFTTRSHYSPPTSRTQVFTLGAGLKVTATAAGSALIGLAQALPAANQLFLAASMPLIAGIAAAVLAGRLARAG